MYTYTVRYRYTVHKVCIYVVFSKGGPIPFFPILLIPSTELKILPILIPIPIPMHIGIMVAIISHLLLYKYIDKAFK